MRGRRYQRFVGITLTVWALLLANFAHAQAVTAYTGKMNNAVGGIVQAKLAKWGFAANDPRISATFEGLGAGLTTVALGVATGTVATVGWPALLVGAGIAAVVSGGVSLAVGGLYKWLFNSDGTISSQGASSIQYDTPVPPAAMSLGGPYWSAGSYSAGDYFTAASAHLLKCPGPYCSDEYNVYKLQGCSASATTASCQMVLTHPHLSSCGNACNSYFEVRDVAYFVASGAPGTCPAGSAFYGSGCLNVDLPMTSTPGAEVSNVPPSLAAENIPPAEISKPVSNEMLAAAANAAWRASASTGGIPWTALDPITPQDVADWAVANPSAVPTVGDLTAPVTNGSSVGVGSGSLPSSSPNPSTGPVATPGAGVQVDLGPNPNTPAPTLDATPTAQQILGPLLNLMPDLRNFTVPAHSATCPKPSFVAFDRTYTVQSHCDLIENLRAVIEAAMLLVWSIAAVFIVLRA
jgi:hypothetical protein